MTNITLAQSYLIKATKRMPVLTLLLKRKAYSDVIREAQEIVELCLKGMLRKVGIEPPKWHDVGGLLVEYRKRFKGLTIKKAQKLAKISKALRKERELSFYGDIDFIPTEEYTFNDARRAIKDADFIFKTARRYIIID